MGELTFHPFGAALSLAVLVQSAVLIALLVVAAGPVRRRDRGAGALLMGAAVIELANASLCCVSIGPLAALPDTVRSGVLDATTIATPLAHALAFLLVVLAVRSLVKQR